MKKVIELKARTKVISHTKGNLTGGAIGIPESFLNLLVSCIEKARRRSKKVEDEDRERLMREMTEIEEAEDREE